MFTSELVKSHFCSTCSTVVEIFFQRLRQAYIECSLYLCSWVLILFFFFFYFFSPHDLQAFHFSILFCLQAHIIQIQHMQAQELLVLLCKISTPLQKKKCLRCRTMYSITVHYAAQTILISLQRNLLPCPCWF